MLFMSRPYGTNPYRGPLDISWNFDFPLCHQTLQKGLIPKALGTQYEFLAMPSLPRRAANLPEHTCGFFPLHASASSLFRVIQLSQTTRFLLQEGGSPLADPMPQQASLSLAPIGQMFFENTFDYSHTTAFSERLCCSSDIASWINQPLSFFSPLPWRNNGFIRLRLECRVWSSQGIILLDAIGVF